MNVKTYQILTNLDCNLDCSYCYERKNGKVNDLEVIKEYLRTLFERDKGDRSQRIIEMVGGESLIYPAMVDGIIECAKSLAKEHRVCCKFSISTNGTLFGNPAVREVIEKHRDVLEVGISIDGPAEVHDRHRYYAGSGKGCYADIVRHLPWLRKTLKTAPGVKATFTLEGFLDHYAESVIHLIELGFTHIGGNIVYEDICRIEQGAEIAEQLFKVADYLVEHDLVDKVNVFQLNNRELDLGRLPAMSLKFPVAERNYCGSCTHMTCLGFDRKVYGCNRFCTMNMPGMEIGALAAGRIEIDNHTLFEEVAEQYKKWPEECTTCPLRGYCPSCVAAPYEEGDVQAYLNQKRQCGFTFAQALARWYLGHLIKGKK